MSFARPPRPEIGLLLLAVGLLAGPMAAAAQVTITLAPSAAAIDTGQTQDFTAVVTGTSNKSITRWLVCDSNGKSCVVGGNSTLGTLVEIGRDGEGNRIGRYTAPSAVPSPPSCEVVSGGCQLTVKVVKRLASGRKKKKKAPVTIQGLVVATSSLLDGVGGVPYSATLAATGGARPYRWSIWPGALPPGLNLDSNTGAISGTPTTVGTSNFTVRVTDSGVPAASNTRALTLTITSAPPIRLAPGAVALSRTQAQDFTAVVRGTSNKAITRWLVCDSNGGNCVAGGNSTLGTLVEIGSDVDGNRIARYTAPAVLPSPPSCVVVFNGCQLTVKALKRLAPGNRIKAIAAVTILG